MIRARLSFRHQKHVQYELVQEALETQRDKLEILENAEREAKRLEEALERGGNVLTGPQVEPVPARDEQERAQRRARATQGFGLLSAVKHSLSGMIDMDPEATRRANIAKTRDNISQVIPFFCLLSFLCTRLWLLSHPVGRLLSSSSARPQIRVHDTASRP